MGKKQDKQALAASQMAAQLAALSSVFAPPTSGQGRYGAWLTDSAQGMIQAQEQYMAEKKAKEEAKKKGLGGMLGTAGALVAAPFTGGASLALAPSLSQIGSGISSGDMGAVASGIGGAYTAGKGAFGAPAPAVGSAVQDMNGMGVISPEASAAAMPGMEFDPVTGTWKPKKQTSAYDPTAGLF